MFHIAVDVRKAGCLQKLPPALIFNCRSSLDSADPFKGILHTLVSVVWEILAYLDSNLHTFEQGKTGPEYKSARNRTRTQRQLALEIQASPSTSIIVMPHTVRFQLLPYYYYYTNLKHWHKLPHCSTSNFLRLASKAARTMIMNTS